MSPLTRGTRSSLVRPSKHLSTPPVTDQLVAHYAPRLEGGYRDGDAVGTLTDHSGNGNDLTQSTSSKKPTYRDNGTDNIGGHPVIEWDGSDDIMSAGSAFYTPTSGEIIVVFRLTQKPDSIDVLFGASDVDNNQQACKARFWTDDPARQYQIFHDNRGNTSNDFNDIVDSAHSTNATIVGYRSSGSAYNIRVDGADQSLTVENGSNNGDWFGTDITGLDNFFLGADIDDGGGTEENHTAVEIAEMLMYSKELSSSERSDDEDWLNHDVNYGIF